MTALTGHSARADVINRLRRAEGQIRGVQRMIEDGESCLKIAQQFSAVRKALDSTYLRMTMCFMEQELQSHQGASGSDEANTAQVLKELETLLARMG